jgi:hypothetical protein
MATGSNVNNTGTFLARPSATQTNVRRTNKMGKSLDRRRFSFSVVQPFEKWLRGGDGFKKVDCYRISLKLVIRRCPGIPFFMPGSRRMASTSLNSSSWKKKRLRNMQQHRSVF